MAMTTTMAMTTMGDADDGDDDGDGDDGEESDPFRHSNVDLESLLARSFSDTATSI